MEDEITVLQERLASVKTDLEARLRYLDESLEEEFISQVETVRQSFPYDPKPTAPSITDENFSYLPSQNISRLRRRSSSARNKSHISDEPNQVEMPKPVERSSNRRSFNVDIMRSAPKYFPPKQQLDQNMF